MMQLVNGRAVEVAYFAPQRLGEVVANHNAPLQSLHELVENWHDAFDEGFWQSVRSGRRTFRTSAGYR